MPAKDLENKTNEWTGMHTPMLCIFPLNDTQSQCGAHMYARRKKSIATECSMTFEQQTGQEKGKTTRLDYIRRVPRQGDQSLGTAASYPSWPDHRQCGDRLMLMVSGHQGGRVGTILAGRYLHLEVL